MEIYMEAYECYRSACENYGMESLNFNLFIQNLTDEQLFEFSKKSK